MLSLIITIKYNLIIPKISLLNIICKVIIVTNKSVLC